MFELTNKQSEELEQFATPKEIEDFIFRLNNSFGDGEVLSYEHIYNIFSKEFNKNSEEDCLSLYIDTVRVLNFIKENGASELLNCNDWKNIKFIHDEKTKADSFNIPKAMYEKFANVLEIYKPLTQRVDGVLFELIGTLGEIQYEGKVMEHCIASYHYIVMNKQYVGFRVSNHNNHERLTLGCNRNADDTLVFNQLKGNGNSPASAESCKVVIEFCKRNNIQMNLEHDYDLFPYTNQTKKVSRIN